MDIIPNLVDGAVVLTLTSDSTSRLQRQEEHFELAVLLHNWVRTVQLEYLILDFGEEKYIPSILIEEFIQLRKRRRCPMLFAGVMEQPRKVLETFNFGDKFPIFVGPEDAVKALRMQYPGLTEAPIDPQLVLDTPLFQHLSQQVAAAPSPNSDSEDEHFAEEFV